MKMRRLFAPPAPRIATWVMTRLAVMLVVAGLLALPALAHMSPPDPTWVPGIYDDADYDDVVALVASVASGAPVTAAEARPEPVSAGVPAPEAAVTRLLLLRSQDPSRAPPAAG